MAPETDITGGNEPDPRPGQCPRCGHDEILEIRYGLYPPAALFRDENRDWVPGGCCGRNKRWHCGRCGHEW